MLKAVVIGLGHIGNLHARIYAQDGMVDLVGVCDIDPPRAEAAGKKLNVPWYLDAETMLRELKPDIASVATGGYEYGSDHYEQTMQAFQKAVTEYQVTLGGEQQRLVALLNDKYMAVLEKYRKDNGLAVILSKEAAMAFDPAADITAKVVEAMDKENIDLKVPAKAEAPAAPAAPAEAPAAPAEAPKEEKKP